ncbi:sugar transporter ERD6-like 7 isoform X2 [Spinacia oleracea]|uniref:Sugar transporter ERD6-like 7 isoform X2 n=1 Tax=Spinacia oleracea TaxID=3562 RepID=A0ABM3R6X9_SPIOL|nr:sugar transporter ERD6-like 7 isoform X2 [Spinacia oleracea]
MKTKLLLGMNHKDYIEELEKLPKANMFDLFQKRYLRSVTIGVGLIVCQQFGGINGICFYVSNIFETAGFSPSIGTIIYALLQVYTPRNTSYASEELDVVREQWAASIYYWPKGA